MDGLEEWLPPPAEMRAGQKPAYRLRRFFVLYRGSMT